MVEREQENGPDLVATPLVENMVGPSMLLPPAFRNVNREADKLAMQPLLSKEMEFPPAPFAFARKDTSGTRRPQAIAHRGYKAKFPENTMGAFKGAVEVGAEAIETDIHLSKDGVVVLSHDPDLKRCFGRDEKIIDCDYEFLSTLKTMKEPVQPMPRLSDLLEYVAQPGMEDIWVLLDIKLDNDADDVMRLIGDTIRSVTPAANRPWASRVVLGVWAAKYLPLCSQHLPGFPVSHIGFSVLYASGFFRVPHVSFNLLQQVLMTPWGRFFIRKAQSDKRPVFAWTVNEEPHMRWDIRHGLDGVITDDPKLFLDIRRGYRDGMKDGVTLKMWWSILRINFLALVFGFMFYWKFDFRSVKAVKRDLSLK